MMRWSLGVLAAAIVAVAALFTGPPARWTFEFTLTCGDLELNATSRGVELRQ